MLSFKGSDQPIRALCSEAEPAPCSAEVDIVDELGDKQQTDEEETGNKTKSPNQI